MLQRCQDSKHPPSFRRRVMSPAWLGLGVGGKVRVRVRARIWDKVRARVRIWDRVAAGAGQL